MCVRAVYRVANKSFVSVLAVAVAAMVSFAMLEPTYGVTITENFDSDPGWEGVGNRSGNQDFGFRNTNFSGASAGELGGTIIRESLAYYADDVGSLDPSTETLTVSGVGVLQNPSSGNVLVGWFDKDSDLGWPPTHFLGFRSDEDDLYLRVGGDELLEQNLDPGQPFTFAVTYDPSANGGNGAISGSVNDGPTVTRNLGGGDKDSFNDFDRFGLLGRQKQ